MAVLLNLLWKWSQWLALTGLYELPVLVLMAGLASHASPSHAAQPDLGEKIYRDTYNRALARASTMNVADLLLPVGDYASLQQGRDDAALVELMGDHGITGFKQIAVGRPSTRTRLKAADLHGCIVIGEHRAATSDDDEGDSGPMTLWCPQLASQGLGILDLDDGDAYPDVTALVRDQVARTLALAGANPSR